MQLVGTREIPDPESTTTVESPAAWPSSYQATRTPDAQWRAGVIASLNVAALVLSVRLILMIAIAGAIGLAWLSLTTHDLVRLAVLGIYVLGVVIPTIWLSSR